MCICVCCMQWYVPCQIVFCRLSLSSRCSNTSVYTYVFNALTRDLNCVTMTWGCHSFVCSSITIRAFLLFLWFRLWSDLFLFRVTSLINILYSPFKYVADRWIVCVSWMPDTFFFDEPFRYQCVVCANSMKFWKL